MTYKKKLLFLIANLPGFVCAQSNNPASLNDGLETRPALVQFSLEQVKLPGDENMGMLGGNYLLQLSPEIYAGPAAYGAVSGKRGGFFTGGAELLWRKPLFSALALESGVYVGGGGGGSSLVGGGLMIRPHLDLLWKNKGSAYGISVSQVRFPNGNINSNQIGLVASIDEDFNYTAPVSGQQSLFSDKRGGMGFDRISLSAGNYSPKNGSLNLSGQPVSGSIGYAGFRADQFLNDHVFWGIESGAFAHGSSDGYAEILGAMGVEYPLFSERFKVGAVGAVGLGGGGKLQVGGGALVKAGVYGKLQMTEHLYAAVEGGIADSPNGNFKATYGMLQLGMTLDSMPVAGGSDKTVHGADWALDVARYLKANRYTVAPQNLDTIGFVMNRDLSRDVYLSAQAHSAFDGQAGGFSIGLVGLGIKTPKLDNGLSAGIEGLVGAAGGGGVSTQGGAVVQVMPYANFELYNGLVVKMGVGRIHSLKGGFDSSILNVALAVPFGLPGN